MRRWLVISICIFNAALAGFFLWYVLKPSQRGKVMPQASVSETKAMSDDELWTCARQANSSREASYYLSKLEITDELKARTSIIVNNIAENSGSDYHQWPFNQALINRVGTAATITSDLTLLSQIAANEEMPLTLRDTAFRAYIQNWTRVSTDEELLDEALDLIDSLFLESSAS